MTTVFYANANVVSIWNNPQANIGDDTPLYNPSNFLDRVKYDSRFDYLNITYIGNFTLSLGYVENAAYEAGQKFPQIISTDLYNVGTHGLGYVPGFLLLDRETRQAIAGNNFNINSDNSSFRLIYALADEDYFYIRIKNCAGKSPLLATTKRFTLYGFNNPATVGI
jgi:hypothetical protein